MNDVEKAPLLERLWADIRKLGLERYVAELDVLGYTIVPPEVAAPPGFTDRLREACLDVAERRHGTRPNVQTGSTYPGFGRVGAQTPGVKDSPFGDLMRCLLLEGRIFEEALMQPVLLTLATHLCGFNVTLSLMSCLIKGPNESALALHTDTNLPTPLPPYAVVMNNTWILTDYNRENGATAMIPGSHKWYRNPPEPRAGIASKETDPRENPKAIVVEAKAGSLLVWHGNMWHGGVQPDGAGFAGEPSDVHGAAGIPDAGGPDRASSAGDPRSHPPPVCDAHSAGRALRLHERPGFRRTHGPGPETGWPVPSRARQRGNRSGQPPGELTNPRDT